MNKEQLKETKIGNSTLFYGNGAKDALKKLRKKYNFRFYYKVNNRYKSCSAGFNKVSDFVNFIKPIYGKYYIYEYLFDTKKCKPYFDYEYTIDKRPMDKELENEKDSIVKLIKKTFDDVFKIRLKNKQIIILSSHGNKKDKFKVSFHIIIKDHYFNMNKEVKYIAEKMYELDNNFDLSVYSTDRLMRSFNSCKNWDDNRKLIDENNKKAQMNDFYKYLITKVKDTDKLLINPFKIKKKSSSKKIKSVKLVFKDPSIIGQKIQDLIQKRYIEDSYYDKEVVKYDNVTFYTFNYTNRSQKCFTGHQHDNLGFYAYLDCNYNVILKCFSAKCKNNTYMVGNLYNEETFNEAVMIKNRYLTNDNKIKDAINKFKKSLVVKSAMGTGKTYLVTEYIKLHKPKRILWLSTRQSYSNNISQRLKEFNFINYLDDKKNFYLYDRVIVQLESLCKLENGFINEDEDDDTTFIDAFDLIVLDEIESILYHFSSSTIADRSKNTFDLLDTLCKFDKTKIIAIDADLKERSLEFIKSYGNYDLFINTFLNNTITLKLSCDYNNFVNKIINSIKNKEKICVISLSTKLLDKIEKVILETNKNYKIIKHTRDSDDKLKKSLVEVNKKWTEYDAVLYSPTISVGVDYTTRHFDNVYSIIVPKTASPRIFKQMLGRIRNLKNSTIECYYQSMIGELGVARYTYNDMIDYFKYCVDDFKTEKVRKFIGTKMIVTNDFTLYNRILMHNKIEDLNKTSDYFLSELNFLFNNTNYRMVFDTKIYGKKEKLDDKTYIKKINDAEDIDHKKYISLVNKTYQNKASESDKFAIYKYEFKKFWNIKNPTLNDFENYFRREYEFSRLMLLLNKSSNNNYIDPQFDNKKAVILNVINTIGFSLNNFNRKLSRDDFYKNVQKLLSEENSFYKDYSKIRMLFGKSKHKLSKQLKGPGLTKLLNNYLKEFGLEIKLVRSNLSRNKKRIPVSYFKLVLRKLFQNKI